MNPRRSRWPHRVIIGLAPLALLAGLALRWNRPAPASLALAGGPDLFVQRAREAARATGLDTTGWTVTVSSQPNGDAQRRWASQTPRPGALAARLDPPLRVEVELASPRDDAEFTCEFSPPGELLSWTGATAGGARRADEAGARRYAGQWLARFGEVRIEKWEPIGRDRRNGNAEEQNRFRGEAIFNAEPGDRYRVEVEMGAKGPRAASVAPLGDRGTFSLAGRAEDVAGGLSVLITIWFVFYSLRLFRQRWREGEIPMARFWLLVATFGLAGGLFVGLGSRIGVGVPILAALGTTIVYGIGGLFVAAAYASGEGEIREGWPGKLTSLDALLSGRWFTRSVGESVVVAASCAAWLFLASSLAWSMSPPGSALLIDEEGVHIAVERFVLLRSLLSLPVGLSYLIVAGLFMPLAFIHRRRWRGWKVWLVLLGCPLLIEAGSRDFSLSGPGPLVTTLATVAALLVPFYLKDVLAALMGALLFAALHTAASITALAPALGGTQLVMIGAITFLVAPLIWSAWRGGDVDEKAVRPQYAHNLAERLSLRAEVSSAREAQLRLIPQTVPSIPGLSLAALCRPAGLVGGDFYDFFPAPQNRLVFFVASGGGLGLASALTIALGKGFLANEMRHGAAVDEALARLVEMLSGQVGLAAERTGLLLLSVDPASGEAVAARRGAFPALWSLASPTARLHQFSSGEDFQLGLGETLLVHTEGLISLLDDQSPTGQREWFDRLARRCHGLEAPETDAVLLRLLGGRREKRLRRLRTDLTTLLVRRTAS